jgi:catechol 2,3-dioxygenase-like lactoylglutathione lyase family enzyme
MVASLTTIVPCGSGLAVRLTLDVQNLDRSCQFYKHLLGLEVKAVQRAGMIHEHRTLESPGLPGVELVIRSAFGRRVTGSGPGGLLSIGLPVRSLPEVIRAAAAMGASKWVGENPEANPDAPREMVQLADPDGYILEIMQAHPMPA